jgi:hypothetical protein
LAGWREVPQAGELAALSAEFPGWHFRIRQTWGGASIEAVAADGAGRPGVYAVITPDAGELRQVLHGSEGNADRDIPQPGPGAQPSVKELS